jgi:WD40 repeat protein
MNAARLAVVTCVAALTAASTVRLLAGPARDSSPAGAVVIGSPQFRHTGWHSRAYFADGGNTLVFVGEGPAVRFWDLATANILREIELKGYYHDAAFAPDSGLLAIAGTHQPDGENGKTEDVLWLVDTDGRKLAHTVRLPGELVGNSQKVQVSADGRRVFVEHEGDVRVIDGRTGDELIRHKGRINAGTLAVSRDGTLVAFGRYDVFLWRWETGEEPKKFTNVGGFGTELMQFAPDGKTLYIAQSSELITAWDVATGRQTGARPLRMMTHNFVFSPDGKTMAVVSHPGASRPPEGGHTIDLLDTATGREIRRLPVGRVGIGHVSWSKDGSRLAGVSDYRAWVWDVATGKEVSPAGTGHEGTIGAMAFGPDGTLFTASDDHTIRSWAPATGAPVLELGHTYWVRDVAVSPDGSLVAGSALRNDLRVWDARTGKLRFKLLGNGMMGGKRRVRFTADGRRLVAWGDDDFVRVWDARNGKLLSEHLTRSPGADDDPDDPFGGEMRRMRTMLDGADISPDGTALALSADKAIRILDPATGAERQKLELGDAIVTQIALSPDGKRLLTAGRGKSIQTKLPDGRMRHSVENEYPVSVWDLATGKPLWTATAEGSWPGLAYSPDGARVAVVSNVHEGPNRVWVWDAATGKEAGRIELPRPGQHAAFDRTGKRLAVSLNDTTALVYDLETELKPPRQN